MTGTVQDFQTGKTNGIIQDFDRFHQMNNPIAFQNCRLEEQRRNYIHSEQRYGEHVQNFRNQPNNIFMKREFEGMYLEPGSSGVNASFPNQHGLQQRDVPNTNPPLRCYQGKNQVNDVHGRLKRSGSPPRRQEDIFFTQSPQATNSNSFSDNRFPSIYYNHSTTEDDYSLPSDSFDNSFCSPRSDLESGKASGKTIGNEIIFENSIQNGANFQIPENCGSRFNVDLYMNPQTTSMTSDDHRRPSYFDLPPAPPLPHRPPRDDSENEESQYVSNILLINSIPDEKSSNRCADKRIVILCVLLGIVASVAIVAPLAMKFQASHTEQMPFTTAGPASPSNVNIMQRKTTTDGTTSYETSSTTSSTTENTSQTTVLTSSTSTENTSPTTVLPSTTGNTSPTTVLTSSTENTSPTTVLTSSTENTSPSTTSSTIETTTITSTEQTTSPTISGTFGCHSCTCSDSRCPVDGNMKYTAKCGQVAFNCRIACFSQVRTSTRLTHRGCIDDKLDWVGHADWRGLDSGCHQLSGGYVCFCKGQYCNTHNLTSHQTNPAFGCIQTRTTEPHNCS